jgi:DNA-binding NtrC family response regulator
MTGNPSVTSSIEALRAGAWDYLPKPFSATHLQVLIGRASHAVMVGREAQDLRLQLQKQHGHSDKIALIGISPSFRKAVELARKVAATDASVFISGESGTGKEVIAQFIQQNSRRASRPLVPINCAALPEPLLESEMFGHRKGAFTGADRDKPGLLETANGGTLFLDELTEMTLPLQAKLLRVIQDGVVRRVGSETQDAVVDVRFVSATNRDPQEAVDQGVLRSDLFYRPGWCRSSCRRSGSGWRTSPSWRTTSSRCSGSATGRWATGCRVSARRASPSCAPGPGVATCGNCRT